jgi:hypothetical protein
VTAPPEGELRATIAELLDARAPGKTICPSDVARRLRDENWRELMEPVREAGRAMAAEGELVVTQKGRTVDPETARGAIRYGRPDGR